MKRLIKWFKHRGEQRRNMTLSDRRHRDDCPDSYSGSNAKYILTNLCPTCTKFDGCLYRQTFKSIADKDAGGLGIVDMDSAPGFPGAVIEHINMKTPQHYKDEQDFRDTWDDNNSDITIPKYVYQDTASIRSHTPDYRAGKPSPAQ